MKRLKNPGQFGNSVLSSLSGSAIIGGSFFGAAGAVAGAVVGIVVGVMAEEYSGNLTDGRKKPKRTNPIEHY